jgi:3-deoxy-D-manno-octulosonic-acid transferase
MITNLKEKKIAIGLINARITKKTFKRWSLFQNFSKKIFTKFDLCLSASKESLAYCKKLGIKNTKFYGNLKFSQSENEKNSINTNLKRFIQSRKVWCASSTHHNEENLCGEVHKQLKKKYKNLLTIIIPRHIERINRIEKDLKNLNLKTHLHKPTQKIDDKTDIYLVNTYGMTKSFFNICKNIFLGGSLINHGGQNPLEATRYGCNVIHGPHISNFNEIYNFLKRNKVSYKISNQNEMISILKKLFSKKSKSKEIEKKLYLIGQKVLNKTYNKIGLLIKK